MKELSPEWCECTSPDFMNAAYLPDGICPCGIQKHHYHCPQCGRVVQIG